MYLDRRVAHYLQATGSGGDPDCCYLLILAPYFIRTANIICVAVQTPGKSSFESTPGLTRSNAACIRRRRSSPLPQSLSCSALRMSAKSSLLEFIKNFTIIYKLEIFKLIYPIYSLTFACLYSLLLYILVEAG